MQDRAADKGGGVLRWGAVVAWGGGIFQTQLSEFIMFVWHHSFVVGPWAVVGLSRLSHVGISVSPALLFSGVFVAPEVEQ